MIYHNIEPIIMTYLKSAATIAVLLLGYNLTSAQSTDTNANVEIDNVYYGEGDHHVQIEGGYELCFGMPKFRDMTSALTSGFNFEARHRFAKCPIDVGFYMSRTFAGRNWTEYSVEFYHTNLMLTTDYNLRLGRFFTAFGGIGLGVVKNMSIKDKDAEIKLDQFGYSVAQSGPSAKFAFMPRVGVTAWNLLRLTVGYKAQGTLNSHAFVSLGLTLGLGRIKR